MTPIHSSVALISSRPLVGRIKGFTLIELMVAMLVGLVVIGGATSVFLTVVQTYRQTETVNALHESVRFVTDILTRDVRGLTSIATVTQGASGVSDQFQISPGTFSGCVNYTVEADDEAGINTQLNCTLADGTRMRLAGGVMDFQVEEIGTPVIGYQFSVTFRGADGENQSVVFSAGMRNQILGAIQE